ncbi:bZIP transcription factor [Blautia coccoides]|uniref:bZIP transcription factor n=1 Tax=Blautia producta TaxID=33035 RepID=UPI002149BAFB|nr:bZIP transcription factor [Blautia coccoides]MCR1986365.1 bZIP transcription factor [Blautia coccoides]
MGRTSDYGHGLYKQLEEVMARLDCVEKTSNKEIEQLNGRIDILEKENADLKKENQLLLNDNARLKSIINNDSSNTSNPPSTDQKSRKPANTYNGREKTGRKAGGQPFDPVIQFHDEGVKISVSMKNDFS